jgi:uncharacterized protein
MARILLLLFIAFLVYLVVKGLARAQAKKEPGPPAATTASGEDMVACARCGVNVPRSETREADGRRVCASNPNCR